MFRTVLISAVMAGSAISSTLADEAKTRPAERAEIGTFSVQFENDLFSGSDRHYTNGIRLSWLSPAGDTLPALEWLRDGLEAIAQDDAKGKNKRVRFGLAAGQDMYTPEDKVRRDLVTNDRPYAGWLYGAMSLHTVTERGSGRKDLESAELDVGVVGPWALAEETQDLVHEVRLIDTFEGWDHQLRNEPGLNLLYERKWRLFDPFDLGGIEFDAVPRAGLALGNVLTQATVGGAVRLGWNLPDDFGPPSLIHGVTPLDRYPQDSVAFYFFATTEGRYVVHNIFLDGNTLRDSHSVNKKPWVGDLAAGAALVIGRFRLAYSNAFRTREFDGQQKISRYGALSVSFQAAF